MTAIHRISGLWIVTAIVMACGTAQAQTLIRMEAEDMQLDTYRIETLNFASNGAVINLKGSGFAGNASAEFPGASGQYDISVVYHDENDGLAQLSVSIGGETVDVWTLDLKSSEAQPKEANRQTRQVAQGYAVDNGDEIIINGLQGNWDNANVDYIEFIATGQSGPGNSPIVLDFSEGDITIDEPGYYVLDRNWERKPRVGDNPSLFIRADDVMIDLRGFELNLLRIEDQLDTTGFTLKNGTMMNVRFDLEGGYCRIEGMRLGFSGKASVRRACRISNSVIDYISCEDCLVQSSTLRLSTRGGNGASLNSAQILDNVIVCDIDVDEFDSGGCIEIGDASIFARNTFKRVAGNNDSIETTVSLLSAGGDNFILDNVFETQTSTPTIEVGGANNLLRGNIIKPKQGSILGGTGPGVTFYSSGNFYGDNLVWSELPFNLGGTTQVDLGGNQGVELN